jgi:integrase
MERDRFKITKTKGKRGTSYQVSGYKLNGQQVRRRYRTRELAEGAKQILDVEAFNAEAAGRLKSTRLTEIQLADAEQAVATIDSGYTLLEAVKFFNANYRKAATRTTVEDAVERFLEERKGQNLRKASIANLRARCRKLSSEFAGKAVNEISRQDVKTHIFRKDWGGVTRRNQKRAINNFFEWAVEEGMCPDNPAAGKWDIKVDEKEPEILNLEEVKALLRSAREYKNGAVLGFFVGQLFAGLRPSEALRLNWNSINLKAKTITVRGGAAKLRKRRVIDLDPVCVQWLKTIPAKRGKLAGTNPARDAAAVRAIAGWKPKDAYARRALLRVNPRIDEDTIDQREAYPKDGMRHTAISAKLVQTKNEKSTAYWAGNSPEVIHRDYKGLMDKYQAGAFWRLFPDTIDEDNTLEMPVAVVS